MSVRRTLAAFICFVILAGFVWIDAMRQEVESMSAFEERTLLGMGRDEIESFTIDNTQGHFELSHRADGWWLTEPLEARADQTWVAIILQNLADAKRSSSQANVLPDRMGDYGLDRPPITATFRASDGREITIAIGAQSQGMPRIFATEMGTNEVFTVGAQVRGNLDKTLLQLRDRRIFTSLDPGQVTAVVVTTEGRSMRITQSDDGDWWIEGEPRRRADSDVLRSLVQGFAGLEASGFPEGEPSPANGLMPPDSVVALITGSGATNEIAFGLPLDIGGQNFYARSSARPELLTVKGSTRGLVPRRLDDWLDRDLLHLDPSEVGRFTVSASRILAAEGNLNLTFELGDDGAWHSLDEPDARINEENLDQLLRLFGRLSADSVVTTAPESLEDFGLQRPVMSFIWRSRDGSVTEHLDIGRGVSAGQPTAYCRRGGDQTVYAAPSSYDRAMVLALDLVDRHLVRSDISHAARIDYRNADLTVEFKRVGGIWRRMSPGGSPGREITVERIEAALIRLVNATHRGPIEDPLAGAVRSQLANPPWAVIIFDAEDNRLADVRASEVPLAEGTNEQIMVLLDEERAVRVGRGVLSQVKDGLDHLIRLQ